MKLSCVLRMKVGFIGAGAMATALCKGFIQAALVKPSEVLCSDINRAKLRSIRELGVQTTLDNRIVVQQKEVVYVSVKPHTVLDILRQVAPYVTGETLVISVAAGITLHSMQQALPAGARVVRVMPNTPVLVQCGASVFARGRNVEDEQADMVRDMLNCVGLVEEMPESHMDAVTGLSGNGPAYGLVTIQSLADGGVKMGLNLEANGFVTIQALADGGVKMGLNRDQSTRLAAMSLLGAAKMILETRQHPEQVKDDVLSPGGTSGAAKMILETRKHPEQLKDDICSPGGTSVHALHALEKAGYRGALIDAVEAGTRRSRAIGDAVNGTRHQETDTVVCADELIKA